MLQKDGRLFKVWKWEEAKVLSSATKIEADVTACAMTEEDILLLDRKFPSYDRGRHGSDFKCWATESQTRSCDSRGGSESRWCSRRFLKPTPVTSGLVKAYGTVGTSKVVFAGMFTYITFPLVKSCTVQTT